jgi:hypothetical protein
MALWIKKDPTTWVSGTKIWVKTSPTQWVPATRAWIKKTATEWAQFWPGAGPTIEFPLEISASNTSWPSTLTGKNYHWENVSTLSYKFQSSLTNTTDDSAWTDLMSYTTIANPATFNTQTFSITSANFSTTIRSKWFRFVVKGTDSATGTITTEVSNNVNISKSALIGTAGTVVIARSSASSYVYSVTNNGTWSDTPVSYSYQWQQLLSGTWTDISGATSISQDMTSFVQKDIRCQVYAVDDLGATSQLPITSNTLTVEYAPPSVTSFTATGGISKITYSYVVSSDSQFPTITLTLERLQSGGSYLQTDLVNLTPKTGTNVIQSVIVSGTYRATLTASDGINPDSSIVVNNLTVAALSRSNVAIAQTTTNISGATNITFSKTGTGSGQTAVIEWTNGSGVQTSDVSWTGNYSGTDFNKTVSGATQSSSFLLSAATGSASITATVVQKALPEATISWNQVNAQSYKVTYRATGTLGGGFVDTVLTGNSSASSVSLIINQSYATVKVLEVVVYEYANQNSGQPTGSSVGYFEPYPVAQVTLGATQDFTTSSSGTIAYLYAPTNATRPTWSLLSGTAGITGATYRLNFGTWNNTPTSYRYEISYNNQAGTVITSGTTTDTYIDNTFNTVNANSISGYVWASNSSGESSVASSTTTIGPFSAPNLIAPTISSVTVSNAGGPVSVSFTGGSGPFYQAFWWGTATAPTSQVTPDATGSASPLTDNTGPSSTATQYMYVRSVSSASDTSLGPTSQASAWSAGVAFNMTTAPIIPTITMGSNTGITSSTGTINWSSTNQASFSATGTFAASGTTQTSISKTGLSGSTTYTGTVTVTSSTGHTASANYSLTTSVTPIIPTITMGANSGITQTSGTINWTSTNQASFSSNGSISGSGTTATSITNNSLSAGTTYTGTVTVTSSTGNTASAGYSLTTSVAQYTVTWNAGGGTGGGSTTQNAGVAHTAPSPGTRSGFTFSGYFNTPSGDYLYGPIASGGSFTPPSSLTMHARWTVVPPNISSITVTGNVSAGVTCSAVMTNTFSVEYVLFGRDTTSSSWIQLASGTASANGTSLTSAISTASSVGTLPDQYYVTMTPYTGTRSTSGSGGGTGTAGTQRSTIGSPKSNASGSITVNY